MEYVEEPVPKTKWIQGKSLLPAHNCIAYLLCALVAHINYRRTREIFMKFTNGPHCLQLFTVKVMIFQCHHFVHYVILLSLA